MLEGKDGDDRAIPEAVNEDLKEKKFRNTH